MVQFSIQLFPFALCVSLSLVLIVIVPTSGQVGQVSTEPYGDGLTQEEIELVAKFRVIVKDVIYKDYMNKDAYLVRWLRTRNNNLKAARDALQQALEWRKSNNIDRILEEDFSDVEDELKVIFEGSDKFGRPIAIFSLGNLDVRKVAISGRAKRIPRFFAHLMELTEQVLRDLGTAESGHKNVTRAFFMLDVAGFNLRQHACVQCIPIIPTLFQTYENYYPDMAYKVYGLNTPRAFLPIVDIIRPLLSAPSQRAIHLVDSNSDRWKKALLDEIDADQLPVQYNGTRVVYPKSLSALKKTSPYIKAVFDRAAANKKRIKPQ